ncbi:MAG TPA: FAD-dependent oxidoreductase [Candidatus Scatomorpha merdipullorum]|uniref:FAD-dependent oxidoreductase n=1 Tax=Candidatus Scatomorpha merdipullorum TaxID=2840927 RepID=A0A9D1JVS4_9FIRM|nr:FAD-dependent oxidoreductase [Candidatus Scatomorpha merdipullorum]
MNPKVLLEPIKIGSLEVKNRFVVPAMGTNFATPDGFVTDQLIAYHTARAKGGYGLIITEVVAVQANGKAIIFEPGIWDDKFIPGWKKLTDSVHAAGGRIFCQLHHCGRQTLPVFIGGETPVAPSAVPCPADNSLCRELSGEECWELVEAYGDAAVRAKEAGFDGVEVHGGHGYMIAQFMSPHSNKRTDEWGGDLYGRLKLPREIFKNIRAKCGEDYPMIFRFSYDQKVNGGTTIEEATVIAKTAEDCGVDAVNITICTYASIEYMSATPMMPSGFNQHPTAIIKNSVSIPVMAVGRFNNVLVAADAVESGRADMICFGRTSLADPELPNKLAEDRLDEQIPCIGCTQSCISALTNPNRGFKISCLINPVTGHEFEYDMSRVPEDKAKRVLVVGGGPGGLYAAMTAAQKGHKVTLCEASGKFGGKFRLASIPPCKHEIAAGLKYYIHMCEKLGVDMRLNCAVDGQFIKDMAPDAVILATGSSVAMPPIPGIRNEKFLTVADVLGGAALPGAKVLVAGGGMTACELADFLCEHNRIVSVVEMAPMIAADAETAPRRFLMQRLNRWSHALDFYGPCLSVFTSAKITEFFDDGVAVEMNGEVRELRGYDSVILSLGVTPYNPLEEAARAACGEVYVVGDAVQTGSANNATESALAAVLSL